MTAAIAIDDPLGDDGFTIFPNALDAKLCERIAQDVLAEYDRLVTSGWQFVAGGRYTGHLNFSPGPYGKDIIDLLVDGGFMKLAEHALGGPISLFGVVGNMNLPKSRAQDIHQDWAPPGEAIVFNIGLVPTTAENGPTEIVPGTQGDRFNYTTLHRTGTRRKAQFWMTQPGDLLIRRATVWHRGTSNRSNTPRPMLSVIVVPHEPGTTEPPPRYPLTDRIAFAANRFFGRSARTRELASIYLAWPLHLLRMARGR